MSFTAGTENHWRAIARRSFWPAKPTSAGGRRTSPAVDAVRAGRRVACLGVEHVIRNASVGDADAIGSVATFLRNHGWHGNEAGPLVYAANVSPSNVWEKFINQGLEAKFRQDELEAAGVISSATLPPAALFGLVDLQNGAEPTEYWLATNNFFAITQYNRSYFYAMSVIELGKAVRARRLTNA